MKRFLPFLALALAGCSDARLTPAPGQAPDWPEISPPRPAYAPLPFTTNYAPVSGQVEQLPPVAPGQNVPYAVRGQSAATPAAGMPQVGAGTAASAPVQSGCHGVPTVTIDGKPSSLVCPTANGGWNYIPD